MKLKNNINKLRNIGIIAHVDAGKTTVSERILLLTGNIHRAGDVHHGNTTLDYKSWEKAHGITVSSAATTVEWKEHQITIIDTPGHIDFNIEVKRALRVLDGAVVVFDAVAGVEPQTETNWRLADQFGVPRIAFVNKMDRKGADFARVCSMMQERFNKVILPLHIPVGDPFEGIIDLVCMQKYRWKDHHMQSESMENDIFVEDLRTQLIENLCLLDNELMLAWEGQSEITEEQILAAIRRATLAEEAVPVLCGTALKYVGVELLLDAVINFLPSPTDRNQNYETESNLVYAFKTEAQQHQSLTFCRVYQGSISEGDLVWNNNTGKRERMSQIFHVFADSHVAIQTAYAGEIVGVTGLKDTFMGHTLSSERSDYVLEELSVPTPVTSMAVEAKNSQEREKVVKALRSLTKEDPTLQLSTHSETGQLLLSGMGELHLQIACEQLAAKANCEIQLGAPQVAYRETITKATRVEFLLSKQSGGPGMYAGVCLMVEPMERGAGIVFENKITNGVIAKEYIPAVEKGVRQRLQNGVIEGHPVIDLKVTLIDGKMHSNDSSGKAFEVAGAEATRLALQEAQSVLLEPVMRAFIECPTESLGAVMGDISRRRGVVTQQQQNATAHAVLDAEVPLAKVFGIADDLRSLSSGRSNFSMEFDHYAVVS